MDRVVESNNVTERHATQGADTSSGASSIEFDKDSASRRDTYFLAGAGLLLALAIVIPWTAKGWVLLLDFPAGPSPDLPRSVWGLDGGIAPGLPLILGASALGWIIGPATASWVVLALFFPIAVAAAGRLVPGPLAARLGAGLFYATTPIVYDRLWVGQGGYLLGYALLPIVVSAIAKAGLDRRHTVLGGIAMALAIGASPHFLWIGGLLLLAFLLTRRPTRRGFVSLSLVGLCSIASSLYLMPLSGSAIPEVAVGGQDLIAYSTRIVGGDHLLPTVLSLHGFWRLDPLMPSNDLPGRAIFVGTLLILGTVGFYRAMRERRSLTVPLLLAAIAGTMLAMGTQGPTGGGYRWLFDHIPGFTIMREPQKFAVLIALFFAYTVGVGISYLAQRASSRRSAFLPYLAAVVLPLTISPAMLWGYGHSIVPSSYPQSWRQADDLMGNGKGAVLFLPWQQYLSFPFTDQRRIANPAPYYFRRQTISGDNVNLPNIETTSKNQRSAYLTTLFDEARSSSDFGTKLAPLNVEYVVVYADPNAPGYRWLARQPELTPVFQAQDLLLYRNLAWTDRLTIYPAAEASTARYNVSPWRRINATTYAVSAPISGKVELPEPFDAGWQSGLGPATPSKSGLTLVPIGQGDTQIHFAPWRRFLASYLLSLLTFCSLCVLLIADHTRHSLLARKRA